MFSTAPFLLAALLQGLPPEAPPATPEDSVALRRRAVDAQATFERQRRRLMPRVRGSGYSPCQERIGRICLWHDNDDWLPQPDAPELIDLRMRLLQVLDSVGAAITGDAWVLGQRVFYRSEAGSWSAALGTAQGCGGVPGWWCSALAGFALSGMGRYVASARAFEVALAQTDSTLASEWLSVEDVVDRKADDLLEDAQDIGDPDMTERFWTLADPLYLVEGNDRFTEHLSRRVVATIKDGARLPWGIPWGRDLAEVNARYGWERGWERSRPSPTSGEFENVIGHQDSRARQFLPPGQVLEDPAGVEPDTWIPAEHWPRRSSYVAPYAPEFLPGEGQVAVFPREDSVVVVAATRLPESLDSTSVKLRAAAGVPWPLAPPPDLPSRVGAFLIHPDGSLGLGAELIGAEQGTLMLRAAAGAYLISVESWSPREGRAGRLRHGIRSDTIAPDLAALSDLLIMDDSEIEVDELAQVLASVRPTRVVTAGEPIRIGWELTGLGWEPEEVEFSLSLYPPGEGFFSRIGRWLGFGGDRDEPLRLSWSEPGPFEPGPWFRYTRLELPPVLRGEYVLQLSVKLRGREELKMTRTLRIVL
jgi:hypothetical protein